MNQGACHIHGRRKTAMSSKRTLLPVQSKGAHRKILPSKARKSHQDFYVQHPGCYDHALLVTGYDVLLSTLQGDLSFSTSSASSFASTHAGPDHFHLIDLRLRHHALSDSCLEPPSRVLPHGQLRSFDISTPLPLNVTMTYDSDPDSNPYPFHDIIAYRSPR